MRCRLGQIDQLVKSIPISEKPVWLKVQGSNHSYGFYYSLDGVNYEHLADLDTKYLSSETTGSFTGVFIALFAEGEKAQLDFDYFEYKEAEDQTK